MLERSRPEDASAPRREGYDALIVGGGPAGLSAALVLVRARRTVLLCDDDRPRNATSLGVHNFLTRDGTLPHELRGLAREELGRFKNFEAFDGAVEAIEPAADPVRDGFRARLSGGPVTRARAVLIACGVRDVLPAVPGLTERWGRGVHHCPYCDGHDLIDAPVGVYGRDERAVELALELTAWTSDLVLFTDGPHEIGNEALARLARCELALETTPVAAVEGADDNRTLHGVRLRDGRLVARRALFLWPPTSPSPLVEALDLELSQKGAVKTESYERTAIPHLYVAGDASRRLQFAIVAAAEGATAAVGLNADLTRADLARRGAPDPDHEASGGPATRGAVAKAPA